MFYTIYKITNIINGKYYIGKHQTKNLDDGYMGSGKLLKRAIEKHGVENFKKEILHIFDNEVDMNLKEKELVIISESTYNLNEGGNGGFGFINSKGFNNKRRSVEAEKRRAASVSKFRKQRCKDSDELAWMKKISQKGSASVKEKYPNGIWKGRKHSLKTIEKMKQLSIGKQSGEKNSQFGTCWVTNGTENKKIKKEDLNRYLELGYNKGRILSKVQS